MGKSSKKSKTEATATPMAISPTKFKKKGKRDAEEIIVKQSAAKKQKIEAVEAVEKQKSGKKSKATSKAVTKRKPETSSSEDVSSSELEEVVKVPPKKEKKASKIPMKESSSESSSSDEEPAACKKRPSIPPSKNAKPASSSENDSDEEKVKIQPKEGKKPSKKPVNESSSDESSSDEESETKATVPSKKLPAAVAAKNGSAVVLKKQESSDSSDSDSSSDEDITKVASQATKLPVLCPKNVSAVASKKEASSDSSSESESDEDGGNTAKIGAPGSKKPALVKNGAVKKDLSDSSESETDEDEERAASGKDESEDESSDESDEESQKKKLKVLANGGKLNPKVVKKDSSSDEDDDGSSDDEPAKTKQKKTTIAAKESCSSNKSSCEESEEEKLSKTPKKKDSDVKMTDATSVKVKVNNNIAKKSEKNVCKTPTTPSTQTTGSKTLFVGNLSYNVETADVEEFFKDCGEVVDVRFSSNEEGRFKGFGHVEFATAEAAQNALELNGQDLLGRPVRLDLARERGAYTPHSGNESNSYQKGSKNGQSQTIFVRGFDKSLEEDQIRSSLEEHFGSCGEITRVSIPKDYETGASKGMAYVDFTNSDCFSKALELNGSELGDCTLTVEPAKPKGDSRSDGGRSGGGRGGGWSGGGRGGGWSGGGRGGGRSSGRDGGGRFGGRRGGGRGGGGGRGRGMPNRPSIGAAGTGKKTTFDD